MSPPLVWLLVASNPYQIVNTLACNVETLSKLFFINTTTVQQNIDNTLKKAVY